MKVAAASPAEHEQATHRHRCRCGCTWSCSKRPCHQEDICDQCADEEMAHWIATHVRRRSKREETTV